ncbi:MAG: 4Fe-4S binding protein [Promethearchaeota archaeon]
MSSLARINEQKCDGCGVCIHICSQGNKVI